MSRPGQFTMSDLDPKTVASGDQIMIVAPDGTHYRATGASLIALVSDMLTEDKAAMEALLGQAYASMGITSVKTKNQIRAGSGDQGLIIRVSDMTAGKLAYYEPEDTTSADDGTNVLVAADGKRYLIIDFYSIIRSPFS